METSKALMIKLPSIEKVFDRIRTSIKSSWHKIKARVWNGLEFKETIELDLTHIVDRIHIGAAFAAGIINGLLNLITTNKWRLGALLAT
jgi:2-dehydro-3-deoxygluconokinase